MTAPRRFLSVCSGIEAASVAFQPLGWEAVAVAEIEPFPCAVLAHHYPQVPNLGDLTRWREWPVELLAQADVLCGGTPCQGFSVAGLRGSLDDERGNLTLTFCHLYDRLDEIRHAAGRPPAVCLWENVPGVFSTHDNAFGCFLAGLAGEDVPLEPPGGKWTDAGAVRGPRRTVAWRVLDAQYCGLAQRRKRVFVVACADPAFDPVAVLFEFGGLRRDSAPSRGAGEGTAAGTLRSTDGGCDVDHARALHLIADPLTARPYADNASQEGTLRGEGFDASEDGTGRGTPLVPIAFPAQMSGTQCATEENLCPVLQSHNPTAVACREVAPAITGNYGKQVDNSDTALGPMVVTENHSFAFDLRGREGGAMPEGPHPTANLRASSGGSSRSYVAQEPIAFDTTQITSAANRSQPQAGAACHPLAAGAHPPAIAFSGRERGDDGRGYARPPQVFGDAVGTLDTVKPHCVAFQERGRKEGPNLEFQTDLAYSLNAPSGGGRRQELNVALAETQAFTLHGQREGTQSIVSPTDVAGTIREGTGTAIQNSSNTVVQTAWKVRRLTPEECEILQGFPVGYTLIPGTSSRRRKGADLSDTIDYLMSLGASAEQAATLAHSPDGPRYKALGNSWAVPVARWIGVRIEAMLSTARAE